MVVLTKRIDDLTKGKGKKGKNEKGKSEKGLIAKSYDWDEESVSSEDEGTTRIRAFMAIAEDEPSVGKADARSGQWVDITMKKVHKLLSMTDGDERKHVLDYTHVDLHYVEDQRKNLLNKFNLLKQELSLHKSELCNLKNNVSINCSLQYEVIREEKVGEKENNFLKEVVCTKADEYLYEPAPEITSESETDCDTEEPLPTLPKLIRAEPSGTSNSLISLSELTSNMAELTLNNSSKRSKKSSVKVSQTYVIKKTEPKVQTVQISCSKKKVSPSMKQLLLTLMEEVKGIKDHIKIPSVTSSSGSQASSSMPSKQKVWYKPCIHYELKNHLSDDCYLKPKCSTCGSNEHLTREHTEQTVVKRTLNKLKNQPPLKPIPKKTSRMSNPSSECKYYGSNKHHPDNCEFYPGCEICGSIAHEITDCPKNLRNSRK
ncbi:hypothetical protein Tco_0922368 [Tanacetum coccineum]|uniref:CCHC-type domain-containing protein n=1 Tax=Tanacetum coccineum TaxID=301880 RepID=A0ABQ5D4D0_9ASTR